MLFRSVDEPEGSWPRRWRNSDGGELAREPLDDVEAWCERFACWYAGTGGPCWFGARAEEPICGDAGSALGSSGDEPGGEYCFGREVTTKPELCDTSAGGCGCRCSCCSCGPTLALLDEGGLGELDRLDGPSGVLLCSAPASTASDAEREERLRPAIPGPGL